MDNERKMLSSTQVNNHWYNTQRSLIIMIIYCNGLIRFYTPINSEAIQSTLEGKEVMNHFAVTLHTG